MEVYLCDAFNTQRKLNIFSGDSFSESYPDANPQIFRAVFKGIALPSDYLLYCRELDKKVDAALMSAR